MQLINHGAETSKQQQQQQQQQPQGKYSQSYMLKAWPHSIAAMCDKVCKYSCDCAWKHPLSSDFFFVCCNEQILSNNKNALMLGSLTQKHINQQMFVRKEIDFCWNNTNENFKLFPSHAMQSLKCSVCRTHKTCN